MDLERRLGDEAARVEGELRAALQRLDAGHAPRLLEAMAYSLLGGGKRLRPILCLWVHDAAGATPRTDVWRAACALEMIHSYSLIHDDLPAMDDDDLRRGQPSCHRRFGEATAILAGDTLQTEAFRLLAGAQDPALAATLVGRLAEASGLGGMAAGQQLDLDAHAAEGSVQEMRLIHRLKTGRLLGASVALGAACAGRPTSELDRAQAAGERLGIAFQMVDDLLDVESNHGDLGKSVGKDAEQHKLTSVATLGPRETRREAEEHLAAGQAELVELGLADAPVLALCARLVRRDR